MTSLRWSTDTEILTLPALRSLASIVEHLDAAKPEPDWLVLRRHIDWNPEPLLYVFTPDELRSWLNNHPDRAALEAVEALELRETGRSKTVGEAAFTPTFDPHPGLHQSGARAVRVDEDGNPVAIGEIQESERETHRQGSRSAGLGPTLTSAHAAEPLPTIAPVIVVLSADAPEEIQAGKDAQIDVRIELASAASPFRYATEPVGIKPGEKVKAILSVRDDVLEIVSPRVLKLDPPTAASSSSQSVFEVRGRASGSARAAILFRQGDTELGTLTFTIRVSSGAVPPRPPQRIDIPAAARSEDDSGVLLLLIDEEKNNGGIRYRYRVSSGALGLDFEEYFSSPLLDKGAGTNATALAYVQSIYKQVTKLLATTSDLKPYARELSAIGTTMCRELFPDAFADLLWENRDKIASVLVRSWEPYIPWELVRLRKTGGKEVDERFMGEYRLIRSLHGKTRPRTLRLKDWCYLVASYPNKYAPDVGREVRFFTDDQRGLKPTRIPATADALLDLLGAPDFDVLHIACHGAGKHEDIERSALIIGDRKRLTGEVDPIAVDATTVREEASLWQRTPLVFLNACESGRVGAGLTEWGGWPHTFWETGAGAFVGTSWSVRDVPANKFSEAFYNGLLDGETLAEAAHRGREAAKALGDGSWLAYKVYGQPAAKIEKPVSSSDRAADSGDEFT
jgi:hypothetical protein